MSDTINGASSHSLIRPRQVSPLPVGPGGKNPVKQQMNQTNTQLTMLSAQAAANTKYDPPVPQPVTKAVTKESFTVSDLPKMLYIVGSLFIVYGLVAK
jgi:hypothetical protein